MRRADPATGIRHCEYPDFCNMGAWDASRWTPTVEEWITMHPGLTEPEKAALRRDGESNTSP